MVLIVQSYTKVREDQRSCGNYWLQITFW